MKAFTSSALLGSVSTKVDGGLSLRIVLPELTSEQKSAVFELQNRELSILLQDNGSDDAPKFTTVKSDLKTKTPSERLRGLLYVAFKQAKTDQPFEQFYADAMNAFCESVRNKLEPME